ncbi:MAG TPA: polyprenyl diphosphate synthase [Polyangiaceae bacterium]|nr:polyprenyl diphosphate synthase [Polyangiaceae bacterium]
MDPTTHQVPRHVAIIMDGNGRWAQARGLGRSEGHAEGARAVRETVRTCRARGVEFLTLYAFSVANWGRPRPEVQALMRLLIEFTGREKQELRDQDIRLNVIGDLEELPLETRRAVEDAMRYTEDCNTMTLSLALSYGARHDIVSAVRALAVRTQAGLLLPEEIDEDRLRQAMSTRELPDVDLLIRTGGEARVSDFLLFESAYAELLFVPQMWPDFKEQNLMEAFAYYSGRQRRFGLTGEQRNGQTHRSFDPLDATESRQTEASEPGE